ncbi:hypothetical protein C9374_004979 [Naegleria lovaniensis]|uniref:Uncharacterized protein n=1 Tax=Naegleria lovaniensis TaxID=51637 RepID=A0AA88KJ84_NAELO|nr:uncharacterized protein C9374_004979 [Naegleria lovaniensis]KAG2383012.1 hypothetical protein C9374_004979 [Naegleria lovaniensis]
MNRNILRACASFAPLKNLGNSKSSLAISGINSIEMSSFRMFSSCLNTLSASGNFLNNQRSKQQSEGNTQKTQTTSNTDNQNSEGANSEEEIQARLKSSQEILQHLAKKKAFNNQDMNQLESILEKYVKQGSQQDPAVKGPLHFINAVILILFLIVLLVRQRDSMYYEMVKELLLDSEDQLVQAKREINELKKQLSTSDNVQIVQEPPKTETSTTPVKKRASNMI